GQSLENPNDAALTTLYITANRDSRMGTAYAQYFQQMKSSGLNLFMHFVDVSPFSKWGSWGALENVQNASSPKYNALLNFMSANQCWWNGCTGSTTSNPPAPSSSPPPVPTSLVGQPVPPAQANLGWAADTGA